MKPFEIEIRETLSKVIKVEADSLESALLKVKEKYKEEEFVLDYQNHIDTSIDIATLRLLENNIEFSNFVLRNAEKMITHLSLEELAKIGFGDSISAIEKFNSYHNRNS